MPDSLSRKYTAQEVERCLLELAIVGGNSGAASRRLAAVGLKVSGRLLRLWRNELHAERYAELAQDHALRVEETIIQEARESAILAAEVERAALAKTLADIEAGTVRDAAAAARNVATVKGINVDKLLSLSGRPSRIVEVQNPDEVLAELARLGVLTAVDSDAVDGEAFEVPHELVGESLTDTRCLATSAHKP